MEWFNTDRRKVRCATWYNARPSKQGIADKALCGRIVYHRIGARTGAPSCPDCIRKLRNNRRWATRGRLKGLRRATYGKHSGRQWVTKDPRVLERTVPLSKVLADSR